MGQTGEVRVVLRGLAAWGATAGLLAATIVAVFAVAPREATMGDVQRIVYVHVAVAWCGLLGYTLVGGCGLMYLLRRDLNWDHWARAAGEVGWLCTTLTLITGSLWAHEAWNTWWTWDPRLTSSLVLWAIYAGYFLVRGSIASPGDRARIAAVLGLIGLLDVPLVVMATRWFRGMHPVAPEMPAGMRVVLLLSVVGFSAFFVFTTVRRRQQLGLEAAVVKLEQEAGM